MKKPKLALVVPCFNEEDLLPKTVAKLTGILKKLIRQKKLDKHSRLILVDDGSQDHTWKITERLTKKNPMLCGIKLSRNYGHQYALLAGLMKAKAFADCVISIDGDLQQDENAIPEFLEKYAAGNEIVYGVRKNRQTDTWFKRLTAQFFYRLMRGMGVRMINNHSDYRLVSRKALAALTDFQEINLFLRGIFPGLGFKTAVVYHEVRERMAGKSKYPLIKMLAFALNGITSFSVLPIRLVTLAGFLIFTFSCLMSLYVLLVFWLQKTVSGWASTVLPIYFIGGVQLLSVGLVGEYIGKIYTEVKRRPRYIIETECGKKIV